MIDARQPWHSHDMGPSPSRLLAVSPLLACVAALTVLGACADDVGSCYGDPIADFPSSDRSPEGDCVGSWTETVTARALQWSTIHGEGTSAAMALVPVGEDLLVAGGGELARYTASGERVWTYAPVAAQLGAHNIALPEGGPLVVADRFGTTDVELLFLDPDTGQQLSQLSLGVVGPFNLIPAVVADGDRVWVLQRGDFDDFGQTPLTLRRMDPTTQAVEAEFVRSDDPFAFAQVRLLNNDGQLAQLNGTLKLIDSSTGEVSTEILPSSEQFSSAMAHGDGWATVETTVNEGSVQLTLRTHDAEGGVLSTGSFPIGDLPSNPDLSATTDGGVAVFTSESYYSETDFQLHFRPILAVFDDAGQLSWGQRFDVEGRSGGVIPAPGGLFLAGTHDPPTGGRNDYWLARLGG